MTSYAGHDRAGRPRPRAPALADERPATDEGLARLQQLAGNQATARLVAGAAAGGPAPIAVARLWTRAEWEAASDISSGPLRTRRSPELVAVDQSVAHYHAAAGLALADRMARLQAINDAILAWEHAKGGRLARSPRRPHLTRLREEVQRERRQLEIAQWRARIATDAPGILDGLPAPGPARADALFARFMVHFRARGVRYAPTRAGTDSPWDGGLGPFACGSFASALAWLGKAAGIDDCAAVPYFSQPFVTEVLDADFIDATAAGNVVDGAGVPTHQYLFREHYITRLGERFYCPTSGKRLASATAPDLVDRTIGFLRVEADRRIADNGTELRPLAHAVGAPWQLILPA